VSPESEEAAFSRLRDYLTEELAFQSDYYNDAYLGRRVHARMRRTDADSYAAYRRLLERDEAERDAVLDSLSVNVTGFFRNPDVWEAVGEILRERSSGRRLRAWSTPCSDGREPYSLAMLALDRGLGSRFSVLGTDIDRGALDLAREGVYRSTRTTSIEDELEPIGDVDAYVERTEEGIRVAEDVRRRVTFERHDLVRDQPKEGFDVVFCLNLLIYIDTDYKRAVVENVAQAVDPGGYVVLGKTERMPRPCRDAFEEVDANNRIYRRT